MKKKILLSIIIIAFLIFASCISLYFIINNNKTVSVEKLDKKISNYNNPIIPEGFKKIETDSASWELENGIPKGWNNGLVIEDEIGNQFVWVPTVELSSEKLIRNYQYSQKEQNEEQVIEQLKKYTEQIEKYGGFYISRYEAGVSEEMQKSISNISSQSNDIVGIPTSKKEQLVWNYISLKNAKKNAQSMYNNDFIESDLITPIQWANTMQWLVNNGYNIEDAKEWGNFLNTNFRFNGWYSIDHGKNYTYGNDKLKSQYNMILSTGATERNKANNIYDLAGNVMEYTDGWVENRGYYSAGGHYDVTGQYEIYILRLIGVSPLEKIGFRIVLYNK